jgi:hypothetical protein
MNDFEKGIFLGQFLGAIAVLVGIFFSQLFL